MHSHNNIQAVSTENPHYQKALTALFDFFLMSDGIHTDSGPDMTTAVSIEDHDKTVSAEITAKSPGIMAGGEELFYLIGIGKIPVSIDFHIPDGEAFEKEPNIATVSGKLWQVLQYERIVLNMLQRMSGIANTTAQITQKINGPLICATRKTLWGPLDKKAVMLGGGGTHRMHLDDAILVKENHLQHGAVPTTEDCGQFFEVEVESHDQALEVAEQIHEKKNATIMLDNFSAKDAQKTIDTLRKQYPQLQIEISGGITPENIAQYAETKPDIISMGYLTMNAHYSDLSLLIH